MGMNFLKKKNEKLNKTEKQDFSAVFPLKEVFRLNQKLIVPKNNAFVLAKNGKVLDVLFNGEHELNFKNLPNSTKVLKLEKLRNDLQVIYANAYFVNLDQIDELEWNAYRKIELNDELLGFYGLLAKGAFSFKVINPITFMSTLLFAYDYLNKGEGEKILSEIFADLLCKQIEKINPSVSEILRAEKLIEKVFKGLKDDCLKIGIELIAICFKSFVFPNRLKKRVEDIKILEQIENVLNGETLKENKQEIWYPYKPQKQTKIENQEEFTEIQTNEQKENKVKQKLKKIKPEVIEEIKKEKSKIAYNNKQQRQYIESEGKKILYDEPEGEIQFVDLSEQSLYAELTKKTIRCKVCGAKNEFKAKICRVCGEKMGGTLWNKNSQKTVCFLIL